ncbi:hypothetical protein AGR1B_pTi0032 [Agrobacterium fabacearum S56]|nr:hypothetical protein AGR1B_pTi0032 [Agrobacterium fabacearum S56]
MSSMPSLSLSRQAASNELSESIRCHRFIAVMISDRELGEAASTHGSMRKRTEPASGFGHPVAILSRPVLPADGRALQARVSLLSDFVFCTRHSGVKDVVAPPICSRRPRRLLQIGSSTRRLRRSQCDP